MDLNSQSLIGENGDVKLAFRKPAADASSRKYRHHSPAGESSSDGSPKHDGAASPKLPGEEPGRVHEDRYRRGDSRRDVDRHSDRTHHGRGSDSYRHSDRHYSRSSHGYPRHDDYNRHEKHNNDERNHQRSSRDHQRKVDKSQDKYDGVECKSKDRDREVSFQEHQRYKDRDSSFDKTGPGRRHVHSEDLEKDRDTMEEDGLEVKRNRHRTSGDYKGEGNHRGKEIYKGQLQEFDGQSQFIKEQRKKYTDLETNSSKDQYTREPAEKCGEKYVLGSENRDAAFKRQKTSSEKDIGNGKRVSKFTSAIDADVKESGSKESEYSKMSVAQTQTQTQTNVTEAVNDLNAAKSAAMKAAELVNKNLVGGVGTGLLTADQKKKLLWGNKKANAAEEPVHHWDNAMSYDREKQDKFNKLMGVRCNQRADQKPESKGGNDLLREERQRELQQDLEKQYTAGLRRRDGRTVGLGL